jgi:hypothetical protein
MPALSRARPAPSFHQPPLAAGDNGNRPGTLRPPAVTGAGGGPPGQPSRTARITVPFLSVLGLRDHIIPEPTSAPVINLIGSADKHELRLDAGHIGLVVGRTAATTTIPTIIEFLRQRSDRNHDHS